MAPKKLSKPTKTTSTKGKFKELRAQQKALKFTALPAIPKLAKGQKMPASKLPAGRAARLAAVHAQVKKFFSK
jgi:hypothetical protein